jgi:hypothetical protein
MAWSEGMFISACRSPFPLEREPIFLVSLATDPHHSPPTPCGPLSPGFYVRRGFHRPSSIIPPASRFDCRYSVCERTGLWTHPGLSAFLTEIPSANMPARQTMRRHRQHRRQACVTDWRWKSKVTAHHLFGQGHRTTQLTRLIPF